MRDRPEKTLAYRQDSPKAATANKLRLRANSIIERFSTIAQSQLARKLDQTETQALNAMIAAQTWQAADTTLLQLVCHKSGRILGTHSLETITALIAAHGEERARELLQFSWCNQTAIEWIATDHNALKGLAVSDPIGYLIYAMGLIYAPVAVAKSGQATTPHEVYSEETSNSPLPATELQALPASQQIKMRAVRDRMIGHQQAQALPLELIIELTQLMTRLWGIIDPFSLLRSHDFRRSHSLAYWTQSVDTLMEFRELLVSVLRRLVEKKIGERITKTDHRYVTFAEICEIQQSSNGHAAFRLTQSRKPKTSIDADIMTSLQNFTMNTIFDVPPPAPKPVTTQVSKATGLQIAITQQPTTKQPLTLAQLLNKGTTK